MEKNKTAFSALILVQLLFGINFVASKYLLNVIHPILWAHIRFGLSFLLLGLYAFIFHRKQHPALTLDFVVPLIPLSLLSFHVGQTFFLKGLELTSTANAAIISTTIPIFTLLIVVLFKEEKITILKSIGFILAIIGVLILRKVENFSLKNSQLIGDFFVFIASICYALFIAFGKKFLERFNNLWVTVWLLGISTITMIPFSMFYSSKYKIPSITYEILISSVYCIVGATILTYFLNNYALSKLKSSNVAFFIYLQPIVASIIAFFFLGEKMTNRPILAIACILIGQLLSIINLEKLHQRESN